MSRKSQRALHLSEDEVDRIVIAEAEEESAWEAPIAIERARPTSFSIPADLAVRAAFLARLHHVDGVDKWLARIIRERIELEEVAFTEAKREIASRSGA